MKPLAFVAVGGVTIVVGEGATPAHLEEASTTAALAFVTPRQGPASLASTSSFSTLNNDVDGTDRARQCDRCGLELPAGGPLCVRCVQLALGGVL